MPDTVKDAFAMLLDITKARSETQDNEGPCHEVFFDAIEEN